MKKICLLLTLIFSLWVSESFAQTITVSGVVKDGSGELLPGANIVEKGKPTNGMITGVDGSYTMTVSSKDAILVFSFIGFEIQEVPVAGRTVVNVTMVQEAVGLDEVVAIGYETVHKKDVTAAVSSIRSEDLESIPVTSVSQLISTQVTGMQNITLSGAPGSRNNLVIRGNVGLNSQMGDYDAFTAFSSPLYVIDGVQTSLEDVAGFGVSNVDFLASLNPADIESIDILKDASAAAIYGSRGANGVIIINTKKGASLAKPEFSFSANYGIQPKPELVGMLVGAAERRAKMEMLEKWWLYDELFAGNIPMMLTDSLNPAFNNNIDYQGLFYQQGISQQYNLSVRGGSDVSNYRLSVGYNDNKGVVVNTGFERYTFAGSLNSRMGDKFSNQFQTKFSVTNNKTGQGNPWRTKYNYNNTLPVNPAGLNSSLFYVEEDVIKSLSGELESKMNDEREINTTLSNLARYDFFKGLALSSQVTTVYSTTKNNFYEPSTIREEGDGFASYSLRSRWNVSTDTYLNYLKDIDDHSITVIAGIKSDFNRYEDMYINAVGYGSDAIKVINERYGKDEIEGLTDITENSMLSYFGRFTYKYKDRYILSGSYSVDGSSRFGKDVRWARFPSLSAGWILSDEPFVKDLVGDFVNLAKLRASWGINGKQFSQNYLHYGAYDLGYGGYHYWANQMNVSSYAGTTGVIPNFNQIGNNKLSWEESEQWDIGFDIEMFDHRLNLTFDAYHKQTDQLFFDIEFPAYSGYTYAPANIAGVVNYGWESMVNYLVFPRANDLRLELTAGISHNENYVTALPNGNRDYNGNGYGYVVGLPMNLYYMFVNDYIIDDLSQLPVNHWPVRVPGPLFVRVSPSGKT